MSSLAIDPMWIPYSSVKVAEEFLYFTLTLMTGKSYNGLVYITITDTVRKKRHKMESLQLSFKLA